MSKPCDISDSFSIWLQIYSSRELAVPTEKAPHLFGEISSKSTKSTDITTKFNESKIIDNCLDLYNAGFVYDGIYKINPANWSGPAFDVYCNMSDGGGWTVSSECKRSTSV